MYTLKKMQPAYLTMPVHKREGLAVRHGYCSGKPAVKYGEAMQLGNGKMSACVYGKPYEEQVIYGHERLYLPTLREVPPPPPLAAHMPEIRRLLAEGKTYEAADLASDIAREEGGHKGLLIKPEKQDDWEIPVEGFMRHSGARLNICMEQAEGLKDYLRAVDFMSGEASVYWTDDRGIWSRKGFVLRTESVHIQKIEIPEGVKTSIILRLDAFCEEGEHEWERMSLPKEVSWKTKADGKALIFEGYYDKDVSPEGYAVVVWTEGGDITVINESTLRAEAEGELLICSCIRHFEEYVPGIGKRVLEEAQKVTQAGRPGEDICSHMQPGRDNCSRLEPGEDACRCQQPGDNTCSHMQPGEDACRCQQPGENTCSRLEPGEDIYSRLLQENRNSHGRLMEASVLELESQEDRLLTIEELLKRQHESQEISQALLEKFYDAGRYFQVINTGELPPLIGQWNINVNLQVCSANITGLQELMEPYFSFIEKNLPDFRRNAREIYGCRGIVADIHPDMHNGLLYHFSRTWPHEFYTAGTGWMYHEFYYYYLTTGDRVFLEEHVVPGLKEIAEFYSDFLKDKDSSGNYMFYPCLSPENHPSGCGPATINAVMDIMVCREVLENLIQAEDILGLSDDQRERWEEILVHLPDLLTDEEGGLKEWAWPDYEENYNHRCVSHHYDVWPADKINFEETPKLAEAVQISNKKRPLENDSCHGIMHRLFTAIRLGDREYASRLLHMLLEAGFVNSNMSTNHYPYRVVFPDMLGSMPSVTAELLVYSKPGRIRLLPCAEGIAPAGSVKGLCLYTFIRVKCMEWNLKEGWVKAELVSLKDQEIAVGFGKKAVSCRVDGEAADWREGQLFLNIREGQSISLEAEFAAGGKYGME